MCPWMQKSVSPGMQDNVCPGMQERMNTGMQINFVFTDSVPRDAKESQGGEKP